LDDRHRVHDPDAASLLRGRAVETALSESFLWALISSVVFTGWRYYQARRGVACALCRDTVEDEL
jgi:hypothetical protein